MSTLFSRLAVFGCCFALLACGSQARAAVVGKAVGPTLADDMNVSAVVIGTPAGLGGLVAASGNWVDFSNNGSFFSDQFGIMARDGGSEAEFAIDASPSVQFMDDSPTIFVGDDFGIVGETDFDNFFGISDTVNGDTGAHDATSTFTASWAFDITGATGGIGISIDMAAMGDFELRTDTGGAFPSNDELDFEYSFDGINFTPAFLSGIFDTAFISEDNGGFSAPIDQTLPGQDITELPIEVIYTMDDAVQYAWNDPLTINDEPISNEFETLSASIGAAGSSTLTVRFTGLTGSGSEVFAFRNIIIEDGLTAMFDPGDFDMDGDVDGDDFGVFVGEFGNMNGGPPFDAADFDMDGDVDGDDFGVFVGNFGNGVPATAIPEPNSLALLALVAAGFAGRRGTKVA